MMEVTARAPGKVILAGEHAVVHGFTAVAASINRYTTVTIHVPSRGNEDMLQLKLQNASSLELSWPIGRIRETLSSFDGSASSSPTSCSSEMMDSIAELLEDQNSELSLGIAAFLWLYTCIQGLKPAEVVVNSDLPLGSGLGSSASFCVALSAALMVSSGIINMDSNPHGWSMFPKSELELINKWAFEGEKIIHGNPSGIDNTVSTFGSMFQFKGGKMTRLKAMMRMKMLITNTKVGRKTRTLVASVSERTSRHSSAMNSIFQAIDHISTEMASIIQLSSPTDLSDDKEQLIGELMEMNQGLLQCIGVSNASVETVVRITSTYKLASKLTGAGGGGCVLTFLPSSAHGLLVDKVITELESHGFQCFVAEIDGNGVQISHGCSSS